MNNKDYITLYSTFAPELIPAHDEPRVVTAMAPVFEQ